MLEVALSIALESHNGQLDKAGQIYILHPLRLMMKFSNMEERIVAVLHDVVEDSDVTLDDLASKGFSKKVISAIGCLTKKENETYDNFINRIIVNDLARKVKIEDIKDNLDITRIHTINDVDLQRIVKYHQALEKLTAIKE